MTDKNPSHSEHTESDDPLEEAYYHAERARTNLLTVVEEFPRPTTDEDWDQEAMEALDEHLHEVQGVIKYYQEAIALACTELNKARESDEKVEIKDVEPISNPPEYLRNGDRRTPEKRVTAHLTADEREGLAFIIPAGTTHLLQFDTDQYDFDPETIEESTLGKLGAGDVSTSHENRREKNKDDHDTDESG